MKDEDMTRLLLERPALLSDYGFAVLEASRICILRGLIYLLHDVQYLSASERCTDERIIFAKPD
uniref:Transcription factor-related n=1 Tax=Arundo donax TaxID=35708 RepID=A0A0A9ACV3_ARUDO